jgi:type 1 glutamine amidotransferase
MKTIKGPLILLSAICCLAAVLTGAEGRSILFVIGEDEYKTNETLPEFARSELEPDGFAVKMVHADPGNPNNFPGLTEAAARADLILISVRRRTPPKAQLDAIREHVRAGKPLAGIRTASHAFSPRNNKPPESGYDAWPELDPQVLGGHYTGHHGEGPKVRISIAAGAGNHPLLAGINAAELVGNGSLYRVSPLEASATALLVGTIPDNPPEPVAWTNTARGGARVFYTSLGHPEDFRNPEFRRLLLNGIRWALRIL